MNLQKIIKELDTSISLAIREGTTKDNSAQPRLTGWKLSEVCQVTIDLLKKGDAR